MRSKKHILILDCMPRGEPSEGALMKKFFDVCKLYKPAQAQSWAFKVKGKTDFLRKLNTGTKYDIIHIAAHGDKDKDGEYIGNGSTWAATPQEIAETDHRATIIFANACIGNRKSMANAFHGAKYYIAPSTYVDWMDSTIFALLFYKRYIVDGISFKNSFDYARSSTKTSKDFPFYWERLK